MLALVPKPVEFADGKQKRAALGRLHTALSNAAKVDPDMQVLVDHLAKLGGGAGYNNKLNEILNDWAIDPSFASCKVRNSTITRTVEGEESDEEKLTFQKLEIKEGPAQAQWLVDNGKVQPCKGRYGRDAYIYVQSKKKRGRSKITEGENSALMDVDNEVYAKVQAGYESLDFGGGSSAKRTKNKKETEDQNPKAPEKVKKQQMQRLKQEKTKIVTAKALSLIHI